MPGFAPGDWISAPHGTDVLDGPSYGGCGYNRSEVERTVVMATSTAFTTDEWEGIGYVLYVTLGWLGATVLAVFLLMTVVPRLI